jgi:NADH-quinone oxidoreductase subunit L
VLEWLQAGNVLWVIPAAPLVATLWIVLVGQFARREYAHRPVIAALFVSFIAAALLMFSILPETFPEHGSGHGGDGHSAEAHGKATDDHHGDAAADQHAEAAAGAEGELAATAPAKKTGRIEYLAYTWFSVGVVPSPVGVDSTDDEATGMHVDVKLRADAMSALMLVMVTSVSLLVAIFAAGYMHGDPGYPRFFAALSLFVFSMCMLVLAGNFLLLFVFWEAVGLCSYLLIGFWFHKPSAAAAAKKAFVVNRIGDFGFILGVFLLWTTFGTLDFDKVLTDPDLLKTMYTIQPELFTAMCLLLFIGAVGKSAQFPLHIWLPDAMEGPTPVSALIHAATMVTAGVYLVARCSPLFVLSPTAQMTVAAVGAITALVAAITALTQYDLKRVLAYSTVSQLGYMFMSLGAAGADPDHLMLHAATFAMFHMFTHAYFKAVLFLSAGSVMHSMGDVIDIRRFSGLRKVLPITHAAFLVGALALAGFPLLSGFWSKDEILSVLYQAARSPEHGGFYSIILASALLTALLTAFYTFRAYFLTFWGPEVFPEEAGHHPHDAPPMMAVPLIILGICAVGIGLVAGPLTHWYAHTLEQTPGLPSAEPHQINWLMMGVSTVIALVGIGAAYMMYGHHPGAAGVKETTNPLANFSLNGLYLDQLLGALVVRPLRGMAEFLEVFDRLFIDKIVDGCALIPGLFGAILRPVQNGVIQNYAFIMLLGLAASLVWMLQSLANAM